MRGGPPKLGRPASGVTLVERLKPSADITPRALDERGIRERIPHVTSVLLRHDTIVQEKHRSTICSGSDEPPEALFQPQRGVGKHVLLERIPTSALHRFHAGRRDRLGRHTKRQFLNDQAA